MSHKIETEGELNVIMVRTTQMMLCKILEILICHLATEGDSVTDSCGMYFAGRFVWHGDS